MKRVKRKEMIRQYYTRSKKREEDFDPRDLVSSLPLDLKLRILVKLHPKSIVKFIAVSKHWSSIVRGKDFRELFISQSSIRPSLLLTFGGYRIRGFHCCSEEDPSSGNPINVTITPNPFLNDSRPVRGLICGEVSTYKNASKVICNPSTGQFVTLPRVKTRSGYGDDIYNFLGYDHVNDLYKVLSMTGRYVPTKSVPVISKEHQVYTFDASIGVRRKAWRMIECKIPHCPATDELYRDGIIYYGAWYTHDVGEEGTLIVSFDTTTEEFGVINVPEHIKLQCYRHTRLVNYQGKLALVDDSYNCNVELWVLDDIKKQEWSKISLLLPRIGLSWSDKFYCRGTISTGELIFAPCPFTQPYFVLAYDLKGKNARRVDIEGVRDITGPITSFLDHVESPIFL